MSLGVESRLSVCGRAPTMMYSMGGHWAIGLGIALQLKLRPCLIETLWPIVRATEW